MVPVQRNPANRIIDSYPAKSGPAAKTPDRSVPIYNVTATQHKRFVLGPKTL